MMIAVTYEDGQVFQHFGKTERFKLYDVQDGKIVRTSMLDANGNGHSALAGLLRQNRVETLICGGIGAGAKQLLTESGIQFYAGVAGDADRAVTELLNGKLAFDPNVECSHHGEHHHDEGGHHCGENCNSSH